MLPRLSRIAFGILMLAACCLAQAAPLRVLVVSDDPAAASALAGPLESAGAKVTKASAVDASALTSVDSVLLYGAKFNALAPEGQKALAERIQLDAQLRIVPVALGAKGVRLEEQVHIRETVRQRRMQTGQSCAFENL